MEGGELGGHEIGIVSHVAEARLCGDGELGGIVQSGIEERSLAMHLENGDERVPVRDRAPPGPRMEIDSGQSQSRRDQRGRRLAVRSKGFPVREQLRVEFARSPAVQDLPHGRVVGVEEPRHDGEIRSQGDDHPDVQVPIRPPVQTMTDTGRKRIIDGRVAEGALDSDRLQLAVGREEAGYPEDRVQLQEGERRRRNLQIHFPLLDAVDERSGERVCIDLQPDGQGGLGAHARAHAAELLARDGLMQLDRVPPEGLVSEGVVPKDLAPRFDHGVRVAGNHAVEGSRGAGRRRSLGGSRSRLPEPCETERQHQSGNQDEHGTISGKHGSLLGALPSWQSARSL
jgi:hypothetical protein